MFCSRTGARYFCPEELLDTQTENLHVVTQDDGTIVLEKINTDAPDFYFLHL